MQLYRVYGKLAGAAVALAMCVNSTAAAAATTARLNNVSPLVALSVLGSDASRAALCGSAAAAAAASATSAQGAAPGCVLPVVDAVPPPVVENVPPPPVAVAAPVAAAGFGVPWILLGLLGAIVVGAVLADRADDEDDEFVDDGPQPVSPF